MRVPHRFLAVLTVLSLSFLPGCRAADSMRLAQCAGCADDGEPALPFRGVGQESGWQLLIVEGRIELTADYGARRFELPMSGTEQDGGSTHFTAEDGAHRLVATVTSGVCRDSMTGMPHPYAVRIALDDERFDGCGGVPRDLLTGQAWVIEDLDGRGIVDSSRITLTFFTEPEHQVAGLGSCNRYQAGFTLTGEGLAISLIAATKMACVPSLMRQEQRFFELLESVYRFDLDDHGALVLVGSEGTMRGFPGADNSH